MKIAADVVRSRRWSGYIAEYRELAQRLDRNPGMSIPTLGKQSVSEDLAEVGFGDGIFCRGRRRT
ncbi:MAG TPA: hypothetical protein VFE35_03835 [Candidatus Cybelea sp.]|jgi:hypothetical protein|nr:hypothetical protein [Candidatus Cybelea sp.]